MSKFAFKIITLPTVILVLLCCSAFAEQQESATKTWFNMIQSLDSEIRAEGLAVQKLKQSYPVMLEKFDQHMQKAHNRLDQLKLLRGLAKRTPWAYRTVLMQLDDVTGYIERAKDELLIEKNRLKKIKDDFAVLSEIHFNSKIYDKKLLKLITSSKEHFIAIRNDAATLKRSIDMSLAKADALDSNIADELKITRKYYAQAIRTFYFTMGSSPLLSHNWIDISYSFEEWSNSYLRFYQPLIVWVHWGNFLIYMVLIAGICWLILRNLVTHLLKRQMFANHKISFYNKGLIFISLGAGMFIARFMTLFTSNQITGLVWSELMTLGIIICARNFLWAREKEQPTRLIRSPMFTLWCLMTAGDIMHMLTMPMNCLSVIWFFLSIAGLASMHFNRHRYKLQITRSTFNANKIILGTGAAVTLLGFGTQAMILTQIWFLFLITIQICTALKTILVTDLPDPNNLEQEADKQNDEEIKNLNESREAALHHNQMIQLFYPLSVSIIIFLFIGWATAYVGGIPFARFVFRNMDVHIAGADISIKSLFYILILFFAARLILFWLKSLVNNTSIGGQKIESSLAHTFSTIGSYIVWVIFLLSSFYLMGIPMSALTWIASGLSIGIGFGLKDIVSNFVSGLIIMFGGSIKKGDTLQHKKIIGEVVDVSIRNTTIKSLDNSMVIIPNSSFLKGEIINLNYQDTRIRVTIPISLVPGSKIDKAKKIMMKVVKKHPNVIKDPAPNVFFKKFGNLGLDFELYFWVNNFEDKFPTESDIMNELDEKFQSKKIKVAFRGIKNKYKPKGDEAAQIAAQREALKEKRKLINKCFRSASLRKYRTLNKIEMDIPE
ncbi:mechanosensitive ion channel family protein [Maridesulfovibrio zosterae]|uniref:mechanosensitive ion channel family protein n=1 Tax=Maridesulfovibrio zosterae TaxID=82171 RepID=UPI00040FF6BA|nr:mechanosensitive ion channel domain-containing protein [Maridesulfovibrio zosterae]